MSNIITTESLWKQFGKTIALQDVSLRVPEGSLFLLLGPNGSGKSTLLKILTGVIKPTKGDVQVLGLDPWKERPKLFQRIGAMFEDHPFPSLATGQEFLTYMAKLQHLNDPNKAALEAAKLFDVDAFWDRPTRGYSSGMKRKLALAHAFLGNPDLLILDEPTVTLDRRTRKKLRDLIQEGLKNKRTFVIAAHILAETEELATHTAILADGRINLQGSIQELAADYGASRIFIKVKNRTQVIQTLLDSGYSTITITKNGLELAVTPEESEKIAELLEHHRIEAEIARTWIDLWTIYKKAIKQTLN